MSNPGMNLVGHRYGRLSVVKESHRANGVVWDCVCDCGEWHKAKTGHLRAGVVLSCGCAQRDAGRETGRKHGYKRGIHWLSHSPLHHCYDNMIARCYNPDNDRYPSYGGRGITVCEEWLGDRKEFYFWAVHAGWEQGLSIDRIDVDGGYSPENCRWVTMAQQQRNTTRSRFLEWNGVRMTVVEWAEHLGVRPQALQHRVTRGWDAERIFTQPFRGRRVQ